MSDFTNSLNFVKNNIYELKIKPNSSKSEIVFNSNSQKIDVFLHSIPQDNKANLELITLFKKKLKLKVEIISGFKSKNKKIKILN